MGQGDSSPLANRVPGVAVLTSDLTCIGTKPAHEAGAESDTMPLVERLNILSRERCVADSGVLQIGENTDFAIDDLYCQVSPFRSRPGRDQPF